MEVEGFEPSRGDCLRGAAPAAVSATPETKDAARSHRAAFHLSGGGRSSGGFVARLAPAAAGWLGGGAELATANTRLDVAIDICSAIGEPAVAQLDVGTSAPIGAFPL
jgi:hypothetical protein